MERADGREAFGERGQDVWAGAYAFIGALSWLGLMSSEPGLARKRFAAFAGTRQKLSRPKLRHFAAAAVSVVKALEKRGWEVSPDLGVLSNEQADLVLSLVSVADLALEAETEEIDPVPKSPEEAARMAVLFALAASVIERMGLGFGRTKARRPRPDGSEALVERERRIHELRIRVEELEREAAELHSVRAVSSEELRRLRKENYELRRLLGMDQEASPEPGQDNSEASGLSPPESMGYNGADTQEVNPRPLEGKRVLVVGGESKRVVYREIVTSLGGEFSFVDGFARHPIDDEVRGCDLVVAVVTQMKHSVYESAKRAARAIGIPIRAVTFKGNMAFEKALRELAAKADGLAGLGKEA